MASRRKPVGTIRRALEPERVHGNPVDQGCEAARLAGVVLTVKATVRTALLPVMTACAGAKAQLVCTGRPVQAKARVPDMPPKGVTVRTVLPDWPWTMVSEAGFAAIE